MCKKFAEDTSKHEKLNGMFLENEAIPDIMTRNYELFKVNMAWGGGGLVSRKLPFLLLSDSFNSS